jgi:hypothetical protein
MFWMKLALKMSSEIIKNQLAMYQPNFLRHGSTPLGTFQNNLTTISERHQQLMEHLLRVRSSHFSICDVGSGTAELHSLLTQRCVGHTYTGIEIVPEMVSTSSEQYPSARILNLDFLDSAFKERFDFLVVSGTFNLPGRTPRRRWEQFVFDVISKMYDLADVGISFNALTSFSTYQAKELFYLNPAKVVEFILGNLSRFCLVNCAYPLYEVTYTVLRPEIVKQQFGHDDFGKYF